MCDRTDIASARACQRSFLDPNASGLVILKKRNLIWWRRAARKLVRIDRNDNLRLRARAQIQLAALRPNLHCTGAKALHSTHLSGQASRAEVTWHGVRGAKIDCRDINHYVSVRC